MDRMRKKTRARAGESIAETLVAVLILALAFVMMVGAVGAAARVNNAARNDKVEFAAEPKLNEDGTAKAMQAKVRLQIDGYEYSIDYNVTPYGNEYYTYYK